MGKADLSMPPAIAANLASGEDSSVGEWLKQRVELLARSRFSDADALCDSLEHTFAKRQLLTGYLRWSRGIACHLDGDAVGATPHLVTAAKTFNRLARKDLADRVGLLLVDVYGSSGEMLRARRLAGRLRRSFLAREDSDRAALALAALAGAEDAADRVARAGLLWRQALSELPARSFRSQLVRANLANVSMIEGRLDSAIQGHARIAREAESLGLDRLVLQADTNLAEAEFRSGRVDSSLRRWHAVIERARRLNHEFEEAIALLELASAEAEMGDRNASARNLEGLEERFRSSGLIPESIRVKRLSALIEAGDDPASWKSTFDDLVFQQQESAAYLFLVDVASAFAAVPADDLIRASQWLRLEGLVGRAYLAQALAARQAAVVGNRDQAAGMALAVVGARQASPWARLVARYALSICQPRYAGRHLAAAIKIADRLLGRLASAADRSAFLSLRREIYLEAISRLLERGRARDRHRALDLVNRFNSGWLVDELARREDRGDDPEIKRWVGLRRRLATLLAEMEGDSESRVRRSGLKLHERLRTLEHEIEGVERSLDRRRPGSIVFGRLRGVGSRLAERLPAGDVLIEVLTDGPDVIIFQAGRNGLRARRLSGVAGDLRRLVGSTRFHLDARPWLNNGRGAQMDRAFESTLSRLGSLLLGDADLEGVETLWVAPHGLLYGVPWAALTLPESGRLVDRLTVTVVPGSSVACRLLDDDGVRPLRFGFAGASVDQLPEVAREMQYLKELVPESKVVCDSDRASFMHMLQTCDAVHLAGHAVFLDGLPAASGLRMSDGFITVHDLAASRIHTRFVSFGVCSGARITESDPVRSEGFLRALMAGGVRTVVGSVSPVRDDVARTFSTALYQGLTDRWSPGDAWRKALGEVREKFPSPAYWGPFQLFGDPRSLKSGSES